MFKRIALLMSVLSVFVLAIIAAEDKPAKDNIKIPVMKFNDVAEVAPGVFFRYSSISATDMTIPFGGSNNIWIQLKREGSDIIVTEREPTAGQAADRG